ncbi:hypothetical protein B566_EDAN011452, partial [Ephemera danica]
MVVGIGKSESIGLLEVFAVNSAASAAVVAMFGCVKIFTRTSARISVIVFIFLVQLHSSKGLLKRCYSCRSRGELGNCKDPFPANGTAVPTLEGAEPQMLRGVESVPCASGWCGKMLEGGSTFKDDAPSDSEERCAYIKRNSRKVFACFCKGDLCNSAPTGALPTFGFGATLLSSLVLRLISLK